MFKSLFVYFVLVFVTIVKSQLCQVSPSTPRFYPVCPTGSSALTQSFTAYSYQGIWYYKNNTITHSYIPYPGLEQIENLVEVVNCWPNNNFQSKRGLISPRAGSSQSTSTVTTTVSGTSTVIVQTPTPTATVNAPTLPPTTNFGVLNQKQCQDACVFNSVNSTACNGDSKYCSQFPCYSNAPCNCLVGFYTMQKQVILAGQPVTPDNSAVIVVSYSNIWQITVNQQVTGNSKRSTEKRGKGAQVFTSAVLLPTSQENVQMLQVTCSTTPFVVTIVQLGVSQSFSFGTSPQSFALPSVFTTTTGTLTVIFFDGNSGQLASYSIGVTGMNPCTLVDSFAPWNIWSNWSCLPSSYQTLFIIIAILLCLLIIVTIPPALNTVAAFLMFFVKVVVLVTWFIRCFRESKASAALRGYIGRKWRETYEFLAPMDPKKNDDYGRAKKPIITTGETLPSAQASGLGKANASRLVYDRKTNQWITLATILMLLKIVGACNTGSLVPTTFSQCENDGIAQSCELEFNLDFILAGLGYQQCFTLTDTSTNTAYATFQVTYVNMSYVGNLINQYYTGDWTLQSDSGWVCPAGSTCCTYSDACVDSSGDNQPFNGASDPTGCGYVSDETILSWPGITTCYVRGACAGNGCFYCTSSCVFSRFAIIPNGPAFLVAKVNQFALSVFINVSYTDGLGNTEYYVGPATTEPQNIGPFTVAMNFLGAGGAVSGGSYLIQGSRAWTGSVAQVNGPVCGQIGELQSNDPNFPNDPSQTAFIFDYSCVSDQQETHAVVYSSPNSALTRTLPFMTALPYTDGSAQWFFNQRGQIIGSATGGNPISLEISTASNKTFTVARSIQTVCPKIIGLVSSGGCFSCTIGCSVVLTMVSTCLQGIATVNMVATDGSTVNTPAIVLLTTQSNYIISVSVTNANPSFLLQVCSPHNCDQITISFLALPDPLVAPRNQTQGSNVDTTPNGGGWGGFGNAFGDVFGGIGSVLETIVIVLVIIAIAIVLIIIGYYACKWNMRKIAQRRAVKQRQVEAESLLPPGYKEQMVDLN